MSDPLPVRKIVSGGQTGVDRVALDSAIYFEIPHGGWCPLGRRAEDGVIPLDYQLQETDSPSYPQRTELNVIDSDGTLILYGEVISGGTKLTQKLTRKHGRPMLAVDLANNPSPEVVRQWLSDQNIGVLNIAGPRESSHPGISVLAERFLLSLFSEHNSAEDELR